MEAGTKQAAQGWLDTIKDKFQETFQQFDFSREKVIEYGVGLGSGIFVGFLFKRYGKQTFFTLLVLGGVLLGLNYYELISIDWIKVKELIGLAPADNVEGFIKDFLTWATAHIISVVVSVIGFIIGYKIG